jgi:hypothetical protein
LGHTGESDRHHEPIFRGFIGKTGSRDQKESSRSNPQTGRSQSPFLVKLILGVGLGVSEEFVQTRGHWPIRQAFELILARSMVNAKTVLKTMRLDRLNRRDARAILSYFLQLAEAKGVDV